MLHYEVSPKGYEQFKAFLQKELHSDSKEYKWIRDEWALLLEFKANADRDTAIRQIMTINNRYSTHLSYGKSNAGDERIDFADFIISKRFREDVTTTDKTAAAALVIDFAKAAKSRGRFQLSFASKYCFHCVPNMFPIYDKENLDYLTAHYSYKDKKDYREYIDAYAHFCRDIGVDLSSASDPYEGFWVDKFINNIEKGTRK
ncbi:MAG: hypothetical protein IKQ91_08235 [Oscillospiraceae bacterium]|nr:hypothetical protein [Oscillospiraceae bacterium]